MSCIASDILVICIAYWLRVNHYDFIALHWMWRLLPACPRSGG